MSVFCSLSNYIFTVSSLILWLEESQWEAWYCFFVTIFLAAWRCKYSYFKFHFVKLVHRLQRETWRAAGR